MSAAYVKRGFRDRFFPVPETEATRKGERLHTDNDNFAPKNGAKHHGYTFLWLSSFLYIKKSVRGTTKTQNACYVIALVIDNCACTNYKHARRTRLVDDIHAGG